jgi:two-component system chemotaxis response regulator CheY
MRLKYVKRYTILLIDDALFCRELVGKALRQEGFDVVTAANGLDGLAALKQHAVHLIVLDNEMPLMDGVAFLHKLRENSSWATLPVIMLTGTAQKDKVLAAKQFGAAEYLLKAEFSLGKLLERVQKWLPGGLPKKGIAVAGAMPASGGGEGIKPVPARAPAGPSAA